MYHIIHGTKWKGQPAYVKSFFLKASIIPIHNIWSLLTFVINPVGNFLSIRLSTHNILLHYGISTKNRTFTERKRSEDWRGEIERDTSKRKYENCIERNHSTANNHKHSSRNRDKTVSSSLTDKPITIPNDTRTEPNDSNDTRTEPNEDNETTITKNRSYTRVRKGNVSQKDKGIILTSLLLLSHSLSLFLPLLPSFYLSIALSLSLFWLLI